MEGREMKNGDHNKVVGSSLHLEKNTIAQPDASPLRKLILVASIAAGVQFGWALQLSLLTPYVQLLGIPHTWAAYIWLCGPISGMIVQPLVGYYSDRCTSRFGRRRPFIAAGAGLVTLAVFLIGFAADIGHASGDPAEKSPKPRAIAVFVVGFWILDVANNTLQGPCRAFLADLSAGSQSKTRTSNAFFSFFMAIGNVLGYAAGSYRYLYKVFPFTRTAACDIYCANLKSCFFISITLLLSLTTLALSLVRERQFSLEEIEEEEEANLKEGNTGGCARLPFFGQLLGALKDLPKPMWILLLVTCLNWIAWFPFLLFDTDWMGKEVYGGQVGQGKAYDMGVHAGALGLMINSVVLGVMSLGIEGLSRLFGGVKRLWGIVNLLLAVCLAMTVLVTKMAEHSRSAAHVVAGAGPPPPPAGVKAGALSIFAVLGVPLAITYSIPFALASIFSASSGSGQGLSLGVLNLAIVVPQDPARAFLADLSRHNHRKMRIANAFFSFFMAVGNVLGYAAGSYNHIYKFLPFTKTHGCDIYCANLKTCFLIDIVFLLTVVIIALSTLKEPEFEKSSDHEDPFVKQVKSAFANLGRPMWLLFLVTALNWIAWFPFLLFNTDWVGKEVYGGQVDGTATEVQKKMYDNGVRAGSLGLMLTAATLGFMSLAIDPLSKLLGGARKLWGVVNFVLAAALALTVAVTKAAEHSRKSSPAGAPPTKGVKAATLSLFAAMGIPQAVTFSIPFALASIFSSDSSSGHGLSLGVLNLAIVIPQMFVSLISGPWDALFGGGNLPAFVLGAVAAFIDGVLALTVLPPPSSNT